MLRPWIVSAAALGLLTAVGCASSPDESPPEAGGDQALADDEDLVAPIALPGRDDDRMRSLQPTLTGAAYWKAFKVAKKGAPERPFVVIAAYDARDQEVYEVVARYETRSESWSYAFRDARGRGLRIEKATQVHILTSTGELIDARAVVLDWLELARTLGPAANPSATSATKPQTVTDADCTTALVTSVVGGLGVLVFGASTALACSAGEILTFGAATVICVGLAAGTTLLFAGTKSVIGKMGGACSAPVAAGLATDDWCAGGYLWHGDDKTPEKCATTCEEEGRGQARCR